MKTSERVRRARNVSLAALLAAVLYAATTPVFAFSYDWTEGCNTGNIYSTDYDTYVQVSECQGFFTDDPCSNADDFCLDVCQDVDSFTSFASVYGCYSTGVPYYYHLNEIWCWCY